MASKYVINNFDGGLNLTGILNSNQFSIANNMQYDRNKTIRTRKGITTFANNIGSDPITSLFFFQRDDTGARILIAFAGGNWYKYDESGDTWGTAFKTGLTATESDGTAVRWSFAVYKNVIYMCDGVNAYASYDGTTYTEYGAQPKVRYLKFSQERVFGCGDDSNPSSLYYTDALPANAQTINTNILVVGGDEAGRLNGITDIGQVILAGKNDFIYSINVATPSATKIDTVNGWYSNRAIRNVENSLFYFNNNGIEQLGQRDGVSGAAGLRSIPISDPVRELTNRVTQPNYNANIGYYSKEKTNYFFTFDTDGDNIPDTTLVYSSSTGGWTTYNLPEIYDYSKYIDDNGNVKILIASASGGQVFEIETGTKDNSSIINSSIRTDDLDFGEPGLINDYQYIDIFGKKTLGQEISVNVYIENNIVAEYTITDDYIIEDTLEDVFSIGTEKLGEEGIGGASGTEAEINYYSYLIRIPVYQSGFDISVGMESDTEGNGRTLEKMRFTLEKGTAELFPTDLIG